MKVVHLPGYRYPASLEEPVVGGDLRYSFNLSRAFARKGFPVVVVSRRGEADPAVHELDGVEIHRYRPELGALFPSSFDVSPARRATFMDVSRGADLVIANTPLTLELVARLRCPLLYVCSGLQDVRNYGSTWSEHLQRYGILLLRDPLKRLTWRKSARVNTTAVRERGTLESMGVEPGKITTIGPGVELERYRPAPHDEVGALRGQLDALTDDVDVAGSRIVLSVARFTPAKGIVETLSAFSRLHRETAEDHVLILVGVRHSHRPGYFERVERTVAELGLENHVIVREDVSESRLPVYYAAAAVTSVFSVGYDPLPTVIVESMSCGTPVVATCFETRKQMIDPGVDGVFVPEKDEQAWVRAVRRILEDEEHAARLREAGLQKVRDRFDMNSVADRYVRLRECL